MDVILFTGFVLWGAICHAYALHPALQSLKHPAFQDCKSTLRAAALIFSSLGWAVVSLPRPPVSLSNLLHSLFCLCLSMTSSEPDISTPPAHHSAQHASIQRTHMPPQLWSPVATTRSSTLLLGVLLLPRLPSLSPSLCSLLAFAFALASRSLQLQLPPPVPRPPPSSQRPRAPSCHTPPGTPSHLPAAQRWPRTPPARARCHRTTTCAAAPHSSVP